MTDTRRKARAMLNDARDAHVNPDDYLVGYTALCRAIERHETFRQEVSDAVEEAIDRGFYAQALQSLIIPKPKPDPLFDVLWELGMAENRAGIVFAANRINETLEARGFEIREKGQ